LAGIWQAATARAAQPEPARLDAAVYVDECHNFLHLPGSVDDVLAEARGYHLALTLAHQHLGQLGRELADGVAANARNKIFFTTSPDDARQLARHVGPYLTQADLCHLDRYQAAVRLVVDGRDTTGFTLATQPTPAIGTDHTDALRAAARRRGRSAQARHAERLARRWTPDTDSGADGNDDAPGGTGTPKDMAGRSVSVPVSLPVSVPISVPVSETGTETDTPEATERHVAGRFPELR